MVCKDTLRIKHLPKELTDSQKEDFVRHFGACKVKVITSKAKAKSIVYAKFENEEVAKNVMFRLHQINILNCRLSVEYAENDVLQGQLTSQRSESLKDAPDKRFLKNFINSINAFNDSVGFHQPPPSHLKYNYPKANRPTINNISHALATVPRFYTQVLHLMNKMNLPPPFAVPEPPVRTIPGGQTTHLQVIKPNNQISESIAEKRKAPSSSESELESDGEENKNKDIIPEKRPVVQKRPVKRPKFIKQPMGSIPKPSDKAEDVFEKVEVQPQRKIELKVIQNIPTQEKIKEPIIANKNSATCAVTTSAKSEEMKKETIKPIESKVEQEKNPKLSEKLSKPETRSSKKDVNNDKKKISDAPKVLITKKTESVEKVSNKADKSKLTEIAINKEKLLQDTPKQLKSTNKTEPTKEIIKPSLSQPVVSPSEPPKPKQNLKEESEKNIVQIPKVTNLQQQQIELKEAEKPQPVISHIEVKEENQEMTKQKEDISIQSAKEALQVQPPKVEKVILEQKKVELSPTKSEKEGWTFGIVDQETKPKPKEMVTSAPSLQQEQPELMDISEEPNESAAEPFSEDEFPCISLEELAANQITDLSVLPVFKNYSPGEPTNKLYIKNCAKTVDVQDLEYIFNRYREEATPDKPSEFNIRLMKEGRMKGQAFVTLDSAEQAVKAVKETNGFILKDKPLVVVFGKAGKKK